MHEETGGPKNSHTTDADQNNRQAESKEYGEEIELQDETIRKILMMFDQQILCETFDEEDTVSEWTDHRIFHRHLRTECVQWLPKNLDRKPPKILLTGQVICTRRLHRR